MTSINKALKILDLYLDSRKPIGISEAAKSVGLSAATTHRIITILSEHGLLEQLSMRGKYYINRKKILSITKFIFPNLSIRNIAWPFLQELSMRIEECSQVAIRLGDVAYKDDYLYTGHKSAQALTVSGAGEKIINLYSSVTGKVLLAYMTDSELHEYFKNVALTPFTRKTITNREVLIKHLKTIRNTGIAFENEEYEVGLGGVAVPVFDVDGSVNASIGIIAPIARVNKTKLQEFSLVLKETAIKISNVLKMGHIY